MSQIPYVNQLGDALETAISTPAAAPRRPRRPRRLWIYAALGALVVSGSAAAAGVLSGGSQEQAANSIACYDSPSRDNGVSVVFAAGQRSPAEVCAAEFRRAGEGGSPLVACSDRTMVAVIPGRTPADCARNGLKPLAAGYEQASAKTARLQRDVLRLEAGVDCVAPAAFARRVQAILDRTGWTGWTARVVSDEPGRDGPCGAVSTAGGRPGRTLAGALDVDARQVRIYHDISRTLFELLYGVNGLAPRLEDHSGTACFTAEQLVAHADSALARSKLRAQAVDAQPLPGTGRFVDARQARYEAGCAIVTDVRAGEHAGVIALVILQKR